MHFNFLFSFFIRPIELILEFIFSSVYKMTGNIGVSVIFVGIIMNILILPIYMRADKITKNNSIKKAHMKPMIARVNNAFKGDERFMMLQALYRENHYNPLSVLLDSLPILFEVPFFIAGFHLLSGLRIVEGVPFLFIKDLSAPDSLFTIGGFTFNILPVLMTAINIVSSIIYTKEQSTSTKVQSYGLAALFLILLYNSPSCLVLYWTTNNLFSLVKNIVVEIIAPKLKKKKLNINKIQIFDYERTKSDTIINFVALFFVSFLTGALVSSDVIGSNLQAFMDPYNPIDPNLYIFNSFCIASGMYMFWGGVIYFMLSEYGKNIMFFIVTVFSTICMIDYFGFSPGGSLTPQLILYGPTADSQKVLFNALVVLMIIVLFFIFFKNKRSFAATFIVLEALAVTMLGVLNFIKIEQQYNDSSYLHEMTGLSEIHFSRNGENVVVIMLDKGMGYMIPYILNEDPSLRDQFDGFTFYENTLSFGAYTMSGSPSLYGGYEYTPEKMNSRSDMLLRDKQNEALLVMPVNFLENGFNVTVCDPTLAGYQWIPDIRVYEDYPEIDVHPFMGYYNDQIEGIRNFNLYERNFFCYGFYRLAPMFMRDIFYDSSMFNVADREYFFDYVQIVSDEHTSRGYSMEFLDSYSALETLPEITITDNSDENYFLMFSNNIAHDPCLLSEPSYLPALNVDNTAFDTQNTSRFTVGNNSVDVYNSLQFSYYQCLMCSMRSLGCWFDQLRESGCYDNTRIIIVADHGCDYFGYTNEAGANAQHFNPILFVKDFNSHGFTVSDDLMTNAETCFIAFDGIIDNPVNPSTGNALISELSSGHFHVLYNDDIIPDDVYNIYTYSPGDWFEVDGDVLSDDSWSHMGTW